MITGLDHANITTAKLGETVAFFTDVLGLKVGPRPSFGFAGAWPYAGDQAVVHIVERQEARPAVGALDHFSFAVSDLEAVLRRLDDAGLRYVVQDIPDGFGRQAFVRDPNGVTVELTARSG